MSKSFAQLVSPGNFEMENHYYPRVLNAPLHPMVSYFMNMEPQRVISRYCHLHPLANKEKLEEILHYHSKYIPWGGADLFYVTTAEGVRQMVIIETNSCPSGQKSMPLLQEYEEHGGYKVLLEETFLPRLNKRGLPPGKLAVVYDKNPMESSGYANTLADLTQEQVYLVPFFDGIGEPPVRFVDKVMEVRDKEGKWHSIRAAFRYVTQRPWNRIPIDSKTLIFNPILACLAGGRNKMIAAKAYDLFNADLENSGLRIAMPETIRDVQKNEIPLWVKKFGGYAVVKIPYSNAGQGVFTITNEQELQDFMSKELPYEMFIVQSLVGNYHWSATGSYGRFYQVGTMPNRRNRIYVADIRMMVTSNTKGFRPLAIYSRRARVPLEEKIVDGSLSWDMLGTNLSVRKDDHNWDTETNRLLLMDRKDFNTVGISLDNLIDAYVQTVLSVIAIDQMAKNLVNQKGKFRRKLFRSLNNDPVLLNEIV